MKRVWGHFVGAAASLGAGWIAVAACAHNDSTLLIRSVLAPQILAAGSGCVFSADPTQAHLSSGTFDVGFRSEYEASYLVGNQLVAQADPNGPKTESSFVTVQGAVVRVTDVAGNALANYTNLASASVPPAVSGTPGYAVVSVTVVNSATVTNLRASGAVVPHVAETTVVTYVRFFGKTAGGQSVESNEFEFPVLVCDGCLVGAVAADFDAQGHRTCGIGAATMVQALSIPCTYQDALIDCSQCLGYQVCRNDLWSGIFAADAGAD